jgi:tetratricopeptide (TPR) repeat protein
MTGVRSMENQEPNLEQQHVADVAKKDTPDVTEATSREATPKNNPYWSSTQVYLLSLICLLVGIAVGYLFRGGAQPKADTVVSQPMAMPGAAGQMPGGMPPAEAAPDPVFDAVKKDPNNFDLLAQAGVASMKAGVPQQAVEYYERALKIKSDPLIRTNLGNAYFRAGKPDESLQCYALVLNSNPKDPNALYNTGLVKLMGKNDPKGAIETWKLFLKYNPDHPQRARVEEMLHKVETSMKQK